MNHTKTTSLSSTTRLSASAKPFTLNRCNPQPTSKFPVHSGPEPAINSSDHCSPDPFGSLLDSFPKFNLGAKGSSVVSAPLGAVVTFPVGTVSQTQTQEESFSQDPAVEFQGDGDFVVLNGSDFDMFKEFSSTVHCSNIASLGYDTFSGSQMNLFGKGSDGGGSAADGSILPKGKHAVDGLNFCQEASDGIFSKGTDSKLAKDMSNSRGKIKAGAISSSVLTSNCEDAPFIFSTLDVSSAAELNNTPHNQGCYAPSVVTYSDFVSSGASDGQYFSEIPSCVRNVASDSMGNHPAALHGPSACSGPFPFDSSRNMDFLTGSCGTIEDKGCSSFSMSGTKDSFVILNADGKGTDDGNKEKQNRICKSVSSGAADYLTNTPHEVTLKSQGTGGGISSKTSSKSLGDSESDLDSPCWKGTMTSSKSLWENSGSVDSQHFVKELEKSKSLNPLAPQFFPSNAEGSSVLAGKKVKAVNLLPGEDRQINTVMAEAPPLDLKEGVELLHCNDVYEREKAFKLINDPRCSFLQNSTCMTQPFSLEDCSTTKSMIGAAGNLEGCSMETKDAMAKGSIGGSFPTKCHSPTPSSSPSQAGVVNDIFKTLQGVSKTLIDSPKLDVQIMVNAMHVLSELLAQTCAHGFDSYKEHHHDTVQRIINNLNLFSTSYHGQMIPTLKSTNSGRPYFLGRSSELPKGVEVTSIETSAVPKKLHYQNDNGCVDNVSKVTIGRGQYSLSSSGDVDTEKGNEIVQVIRRSLGKIQDVEEHLHPQALLYKNLWLDAEAALCYMRRKIYVRLMETGMDVNHTDFVDLWR